MLSTPLRGLDNGGFSMKELNKKGQVFDTMSALGVGIAGLAITLVVVFLILSKTKTNATVAADGNSTAALNTVTAAAADIPG